MEIPTEQIKYIRNRNNELKAKGAWRALWDVDEIETLLGVIDSLTTPPTPPPATSEAVPGNWERRVDPVTGLGTGWEPKKSEVDRE